MYIVTSVSVPPCDAPCADRVRARHGPHRHYCVCRRLSIVCAVVCRTYHSVVVGGVRTLPFISRCMHDMSRARVFDVLRSLVALADATIIVLCGPHTIACRSPRRTTVTMYVLPLYHCIIMSSYHYIIMISYASVYDYIIISTYQCLLNSRRGA